MTFQVGGTRTLYDVGEGSGEKQMLPEIRKVIWMVAEACRLQEGDLDGKVIFTFLIGPVTLGGKSMQYLYDALDLKTADDL